MKEVVSGLKTIRIGASRGPVDTWVRAEGQAGVPVVLAYPNGDTVQLHESVVTYSRWNRCLSKDELRRVTGSTDAAGGASKESK